MRRDESQLSDAISDAVELDRRTVNRAMAWSVPVVMAAVAAPAATGSPHPPKVTAQPGTGTRGGTSNARYVDFAIAFTSDQTATITLTSLAPDDKWSAVQGQTWPNKVVSLASGSNVVKFRLNRNGNAAGAYTLNYGVTGVSGSQSVAITIG
ncbi:hypothetical protein [Phycicoccus sp. SLBN-51]|uniref:hypothetical protein n=1 Tax=Phycicoccus sp. SLBN-51 TaxID=2768447 RepID=UPI00114FDCEB|nr:hypothetical protein [Phycicoccus sp. SLBN-51]TQJ49864.1 hypothetical protein FBY26_1557 [Phycicoccus sp. SLBN-51]